MSMQPWWERSNIHIQNVSLILLTRYLLGIRMKRRLPDNIITNRVSNDNWSFFGEGFNFTVLSEGLRCSIQLGSQRIENQTVTCYRKRFFFILSCLKFKRYYNIVYQSFFDWHRASFLVYRIIAGIHVRQSFRTLLPTIHIAAGFYAHGSFASIANYSEPS